MEFSRPMDILITGGAGFQGTHLAQKMLALGHDVTVLNTLTPQASGNEQYLKGCHVLWGSVTDAEVTEKAMRGKRLVFHLGARVNVDESIAHPWEAMEVNVRGTYNVLEAVKKTGARMIFTSSCEVYGLPEKAPVSENAELRPMSPYAASKAAADRLCFAYAQTYKTPVTIARFFNIYGERQKEGTFGAVIPIFVARALAGKPITVFGDGEQTRDYLHVSDVMRAYEMLLKHPELSGEVVNFGSGKATRIKDIAEHIAKRMKGSVVYAEGRPGEASNMIADYFKAERLLGWKPTVNIFDGIDRYIEWRRVEADKRGS